MNVQIPKFAEPSPIHDVKWVPLKFFRDDRGWLTELFRDDLIDPKYHPVMAYVSLTRPGVARGPHEHAEQADYFAFIGPSTFRVYLWDARKDYPSYGKKEVREVGEAAPFALLVPPGVVHAYKNVGDKDGCVFNAANRLYGGWLKQDSVDEIRHEKDPATPYRLD
jgi:dTDP-4-dehydrorhamnose 3,5-epimerase